MSLFPVSMFNCNVPACSKQKSNMTAFCRTILCSVQCCWTYLSLAAVNKANNSLDMKSACSKRLGYWIVHSWVYISKQTLSCTLQKLFQLQFWTSAHIVSEKKPITRSIRQSVHLQIVWWMFDLVLSRTSWFPPRALSRLLGCEFSSALQSSRKTNGSS